MTSTANQLVAALAARNQDSAKHAALSLVHQVPELRHQFDVSFETTDDFGGVPAAFVDLFPKGDDLARDHKKFGGVFVRIWLFGNPPSLTYGLFLGAERAEQSEPRRGVAYTRQRIGSILEAFEQENHFEYHTWTSSHFPWVTKSSRAVARQLEQFITFRQEPADHARSAATDNALKAAVKFLDRALARLKPIQAFGRSIIHEYYSENLPSSPGAPPVGDIASMATAFTNAATDPATGLHLLEGLGPRLIASLLAKRLLILTGLSGSGKTRLAQAFAVWLCKHDETGASDQYVVQAVGSDWTNREPLLGYPDALSTGDYRMPPSMALPLILRAIDKPAVPHFLILDEMNLSHVERYFADMLSAMEAGQQIALHEKSTPDGKNWSGVPAEITLPPNLFVIGTVNVDETTYMFSPKVLDRANVIEFRVSAPEIDQFLKRPKSVDLSQLNGKGIAYAEPFVQQAARQDVSSDDLGEDTRTEARATLNALFAALAPIGAEFGYRPAYEISRFIYFHQTVSGAVWTIDKAIDAAIMQKLLPKLHGSKSRLGPVLTELKKVVTQARFPISFAKIERMELRLKQNGFTSYAEA